MTPAVVEVLGLRYVEVPASTVPAGLVWVADWANPETVAYATRALHAADVGDEWRRAVDPASGLVRYFLLEACLPRTEVT
jgi:hypothetical protein